MEHCILQFAEKLRAHAPELGECSGVEWLISTESIAYPIALAAMEQRVAAISAGEAPELIWFLEHPPLYTAGTSSKPSGLLDGERFPVYKAGRGGEHTYHGPGQLVAYVMFDLNRRGRDLRAYVHNLEAWIIAALADYGLLGERRCGRPGIWISGESDAKIAALGVRVRRWVAYHGVAINICPDLSHFEGIVPCGITDASVTSLAALGAIPSAH